MQNGRERNPCILLVEDEAVLLELAIEILTHSGAEVTFATNGQEALKLLSEREQGSTPFDQIWTDIQMPVKNGIQFIHEAIKYHPTAMSDIGLVVMSATIEDFFPAREQELVEEDVKKLKILNKPYHVNDMYKFRQELGNRSIKLL